MASLQSMSFRADDRKRRKLLYTVTETSSFVRTAIYSAFVVKGIFYSIQHKFSPFGRNDKRWMFEDQLVETNSPPFYFPKTPRAINSFIISLVPA
jgi:hypothetical protein